MQLKLPIVMDAEPPVAVKVKRPTNESGYDQISRAQQQVLRVKYDLTYGINSML